MKELERKHSCQAAVDGNPQEVSLQRLRMPFASQKAFSLEDIERDSPGGIIGTMESPPGSVSEQLHNLKLDIVDIHEKYNKSTQLLKQKEDENRKLKEKLMALELTIQHLFDSTRASGSGCCSQSCTVI